MTAATDRDILLKMVEQIRDDFAAERVDSHEHRSRLHQRLDEVHERLSHLDTTVAVAGQVDAQVRDELDSLTAKVKAMQPVVEEWQSMIRTGRRISWFIGISGLISGAGLIAAFQWCGDALASFLRHLLRLQ